MASRLGATLMTFDKQLVASAKKLGVPVERE
jgi:predicted nucleic acid-binding protein